MHLTSVRLNAFSLRAKAKKTKQRKWDLKIKKVKKKSHKIRVLVENTNGKGSQNDGKFYRGRPDGPNGACPKKKYKK